MSDVLEPRRVEIRDIPDWLRESFGLFKRKPVLFSSLSIIYFLLGFSTMSIGALGFLLTILLCQIAICILVMIAQAADHSKRVNISAGYKIIRNVIGYLLLLTLLYAMIYIAIFLVTQFIEFDVPSTPHTSETVLSLISVLIYGDFAFKIIYLGVTITTFWFLTPIISLTELKLGEAISLARRGECKNALVVYVASYGPLFVIVAASLVSELSLFLSIILLPLFGAYQYVSYRHVYLGRKNNNPALARQRAAKHTYASQEF